MRKFNLDIRDIIKRRAPHLGLSTKIKLSKRERFYVIAGMSALLLFVVFQFVLFPSVDAKARIKRSIRANEKVLEEIVSLGSEYKAIKFERNDVTQAISRRAKDFTLFSFLEKQAGRAGVKANIKYMKPSTSTEEGPYKEASVEMKLDDVSLKQLVNYLYYIESSQNMVTVKRISIKQGRSSPEYLTVLMQVITYQ